MPNFSKRVILPTLLIGSVTLILVTTLWCLNLLHVTDHIIQHQLQTKLATETQTLPTWFHLSVFAVIAFFSAISLIAVHALWQRALIAFLLFLLLIGLALLLTLLSFSAPYSAYVFTLIWSSIFAIFHAEKS